MINQMTINGVKAVTIYASDIGLFRGEFIGLNGGADFYAADRELKTCEGAISLKVWLWRAVRYGIEAFKAYCTLATSQPMGQELFLEKSLNQFGRLD